MEHYGFIMNYFPRGVVSDRSVITFEIKTYKEGQATKFQEILECELDIPIDVYAECPEIPWIKHILTEALSMADTAADVAAEVSNDPAVVKAALAAHIKMLAH